MRVLAFADEPPRADPAELVASNGPELVVTLGDLRPEWIESLADGDVPKLGVHGNHDGEDDLERLGIRDLHLDRVEVGGWSFAGFGGSVRTHGAGPHAYTQKEAARAVRRLPPAEVLITHSPPRGINDEPGDPVHEGFDALRDWVERHEPRYVLHGHTTPDPRTAVSHVGPTEIVWVRGARVLELKR